MLGKLIKHEFKATSRDFCAMYILVFAITIILKVLMEVQDIFHIDNMLMSFATGTTLIAFVLGIVALILGTYIFILKRFYDNMLKDEGYLSFTLPVSTGQHIASKSIVSYIWIIASGLCICLMVFILLLGGNETITLMREGFVFIVDEITEMGAWHYVIEIVLLLVLSIYVYISMGYACFSIGQTFGKNKVLGAFVSYIAIYFIQQIVSTIFMIIIFGANMDTVNEINQVGMGDALFGQLMIFSLVLTVIEAVAFTVITHIMLSRKLNLE